MQCHGSVSQLAVGPGQVSSLPSVLGSTFCALVEGDVGDGMDAQAPPSSWTLTSQACWGRVDSGPPDAVGRPRALLHVAVSVCGEGMRAWSLMCPSHCDPRGFQVAVGELGLHMAGEKPGGLQAWALAGPTAPSSQALVDVRSVL